MRAFALDIRPQRLALCLLLGSMISVFASCHRESKSVCEHLRELAEQSEHYSPTNKSYSRCIKEMNAYFEAGDEQFLRLKNCILDADTIEEADRC